MKDFKKGNLLNFYNCLALKALFHSNPASETILYDACEAMKNALSGKASPSFYVYPIDTGLGKSTLIKSFLAEWKAEGFKPEGSILIALNTKAEIEDFAVTTGLDANDYAAYTGDDKINTLGASVNRADRVPVLFTTHAMIRARLSKKSFSSAREFFYNGKPRTLRVWDEECTRAEPIHLTLDDLARLKMPIRPYYPSWIEGLEKLIAQIAEVPVDAVVTMPEKLGNGLQYEHVDGRPPIIATDLVDIAKRLKRAAGKQLRVCDGRWYGRTLIGSGPALPADLAPMFIFDAGARIGESYHRWGATADVAIMPPLVRDYRNLTVRIWKTACGSRALENGETKHRLLNGIATTLNLDPQSTLMIGSKPVTPLFDLHANLSGYLDHPADLSFLHWGRHYGTNEFATIKRLVVIGTHSNRDTGDKASYLASSGIDGSTPIGSEWIETSNARRRRNLLQAFSRGAVRRGSRGECGESVVYLIASPSPNPEAMVREVFPNCQIESWEPYGTTLKGQAKKLFEILESYVDKEYAGTMSKKDIRMMVPIASPSRFSQIISKPEFRNAIKGLGISCTKPDFVFEVPQATVFSIADARRRWNDRREKKALAA